LDKATLLFLRRNTEKILSVGLRFYEELEYRNVIRASGKVKVANGASSTLLFLAAVFVLGKLMCSCFPSIS